MGTERIRIWGAFLVVCVVWGSTWLVIKIGGTALPPFLAAGVRFTIAALVLFTVVRMRGLEVPLSPDARKVYGTLGLFSFTIPFALVYWAQPFIPSALSSILFGAYPFWVAIFSHLLLPAERLDSWKIGGITLGFLGILVIFAGDLKIGGSGALPAMAAILASTALQGFSLVIVKRYGQPISPFVMNLVGMAIGAVFLLALSFSIEPVGDVVWNTTAVGSILYLAVVGSILTFVSYYWLLKRIEAVYLSLTSFINPVVAVVLGAAILGERLAAGVFAGAALVLGGILLANGKSIYAKMVRAD
jgi:drug/metabolite transporter (DMT)-like permease